jgi:hypothetical protein
MATTELEKYLKDYEAPGGIKLFAGAKVEMLEHYSMAGLYDLSGSVGKWQHVVDNLFDGAKASADIFMLKVRDAKLGEQVQAGGAAKRLGKAAAKHEALEKMRAADEKGPQPEKPKQPVPTKSAFAALMPGAKAPGATDSFQDTRVISVPFPKKGFDAFGSECYKAFRDDAAVREKMIGWQLITEGLGASPSAIIAAQKAALETDKMLMPTHPYFIYHQAWRFRLSSIALQSLAEAYKMTVSQLLHKSVNATHFLKVTGAANRALIADGKEARTHFLKVPAGEKARQVLQTEARRQLEMERDLVLKPLNSQFATLQADTTSELLADGLGSLALIDMQHRLQALAGQINGTKQQYKKLEAELKAKHMAQDAEVKAAGQKRQKTVSRRPWSPARASTTIACASPDGGGALRGCGCPLRARVSCACTRACARTRACACRGD